MKMIYIFMYILMMMIFLPLHAQSPASEILISYEARFLLMDSLINNHAVRLDSVLYDLSTLPSPIRVQEIDDAVNAKVSAFKSATGLEISGQSYYRPGEGIGYDPDDPLAAYNFKAQVELQWHMFQSSLYKRASKLQQLKLQGDIRQLDMEKQALAQTIVDQKLASKRKHDAILLNLLEYHSDNLNLLTTTQEYLLENRKISSDDLLRLLNEKAEVDRQMTTILSDTVVRMTETPLSALITLTDTVGLMSHINAYHHDLLKMDMQMDLIECQRRGISYWESTSISPFARYSVYNRPAARHSTNIDLGVSFKIPLTDQTRRERRVLKAEAKVAAYEREKLQEQIEREVRLILRDLNNYNKNIEGEYERMNRLKQYLNMRSNSYDNRVGEYSRLSRLQEYNAYLTSWERLVDFEYQRDSKLIDLQGYVMDVPVSSFIEFVTLN